MYFCRDTHIMRTYSISDKSRKRLENDSKTTRKKNEDKVAKKQREINDLSVVRRRPRLL